MEIDTLLAELTPKQREFWKQFELTGNATEAYRIAYPVAANWKDASVGREAYALLKSPKIASIREAKAREVVDDVLMDARRVLREWVDIATADPNELIAHVRWNCRHCWGVDGHRQWRDENEWAEAAAKAVQDHKAAPNNQGGYGFKNTRDPNPECTRCDGLGHGTTVIADTAKVQGKARKLYAGVKQTKDGLQILLRDQDAALANIARHLGMFQDNVNLKGFVAHADVPLTDEQRTILTRAIRNEI